MQVCGEELGQKGVIGLNIKNHGLRGHIKDPMPDFKKLDNYSDQCGMKKKVPFQNILDCKRSHQSFLVRHPSISLPCTIGINMPEPFC